MRKTTKLGSLKFFLKKIGEMSFLFGQKNTFGLCYQHRNVGLAATIPLARSGLIHIFVTLPSAYSMLLFGFASRSENVWYEKNENWGTTIALLLNEQK